MIVSVALGATLQLGGARLFESIPTNSSYHSIYVIGPFSVSVDSSAVLWSVRWGFVVPLVLAFLSGIAILFRAHIRRHDNAA